MAVRIDRRKNRERIPMRRWNRKIVAWLGVGLLFVAGWANAQEAPLSSAANPMDRVVALRLEGDVLLRQALDSIGESVGLKFTLDTRVLAGWLAEGEEPRFSAPTGRRKVSEHLERLLGPEGLVAVYLDGTWLVTPEDRAFHLQMRQKVDLDWKDRSLEKCLEELAESKKINLVVDPRKIGVGRAPVTLRLRGATLEAALRLAAEMAGLTPVPVGNVVFFTTPDSARSLRGGDLSGPGGGDLIPAGLFEREGFIGPAPALPPLKPVPDIRPLPNPGPAAPPPGVPPMGAGPGPGAAPFLRDGEGR